MDLYVNFWLFITTRIRFMKRILIPDPPKLIGSDRIPIVNPAFNKPYKVSTNLMSLRCVGAAGVHADQLLGEREPLPVGGQLHHRDLGLRQSVRFNRNLKNTN